MMTLGELIDRLRKEDPGKIVPLGFNNPHSYRGFYECLAFEPARNVRVADMLRCAEEAKGSIFMGWKGGEFKMDEYTDVWLAIMGECGETIGPILLDFMLSYEI